jgi:hypothetical protein
MSAQFSRSARPLRHAVATFDRYEEAERAVDLLSDRGFPVEHVAIVGRDLRYVEQVTGRMTSLRAALNGALSGALIGVLIGWLFGVFDWFTPVVDTFWLVIDGLWFGALAGALIGLLLHVLQGGRRDFASVDWTVADRYEVTVDDESLAGEAQRILGRQEFRGGSPADLGAASDTEPHPLPDV